MGEKIRNDLTEAMKAGDAGKTGVLRMLVAALHNAEIEKRGRGTPTSALTSEVGVRVGVRETVGLAEEEELAALKKEMKKRKEAAELYRQGGRAELAEKEIKEAEIIAVYLPPAVGREEIERAVEEVIADGKTEFGPIMKQVMGKLKGAADGGEVSKIIKDKLGV